MVETNRQLGLGSATALVVANMIGTGVFTTSGFLLADLHSRWSVLAAWAVGGVMATLGALSYGALARRIPESGGEYLFLSRTLHPAAGYLAGWVSLLVGFSAPLAAVAFAFGEYAKPWLPAWPARMSGTLLLIAFSVVHAANVRRGAWVQNAAVLLKIALIALFTGFALGRLPVPAESATEPAPLSAFGVSLVWISFSYSGWNAAVYIGGEVRDPERNLPRALLLGTILVTLLYLGLNAVFVFAAPIEQLAGKLEIGRIAAEHLGGPALANAVGALIALALVSSISAMVMAGPRVYARMAADGYLPRWLRTEQGPPRPAIYFQGAIALLLLWTATYEGLLTYIGFTLGLSTAATVLGLVRLRRREGASLRVPGWPWVPALFLAGVAGMTLFSIARRPAESLLGLSITNGYDQYLRRTNLTALASSVLNWAFYTYDSASRLSTASDGTNNATYSHLANSPLISQIVFTSNSVARMTTSKSYDYLNRLTQISSAPSASPAVQFNYAYNSANQRVSVTNADKSRWVYTYDSLGQVISGKKYWSDGSAVAGQQFEYTFDDIGNRTQTKSGGDENGANLRTNSYTANSLNQYTSRDVPGYVDIFGLSFATNTVTVNGQTAYRKVEYFRKELPVTNGAVALWTNITVAATGQSSVSGYVFVPKTGETFGYDADGNMTNDGRWVMTWDAENRLIQVESLSSGPTASKRKVIWEYDGKGRRIRQTTYDLSSGTNVVEDLKFLSDGWRNIAELNATNNALIRSYCWGLDVSGSTDGAGGVGGLLMLHSAANGAHFCAYDANGNIARLVKSIDGTVSASYEYDPFGQTIRATGLMAKENPFRFSTKRTDNNTDFLLYEYRFYNSSTGRWLSRDPIQELGFSLTLVDGRSLEDYSFVHNNAVDQIDNLGLISLNIPVLLYFSCNSLKCGHYRCVGLYHVKTLVARYPFSLESCISQAIGGMIAGCFTANSPRFIENCDKWLRCYQLYY